MNWPFAFLSGFAALTTIVFASHARQDARTARFLAELFFLNWAQFVLAWTQFAPAPAFRHWGIEVYGDQLWVLVDALCGSVAGFLVGHRWWGIVLWVASVAQITIFSLGDAHLIDFDQYDHLLDVVFWGQCFIFFWLGGPGIHERIRDYLISHDRRILRARTHGLSREEKEMERAQ